MDLGCSCCLISNHARCPQIPSGNPPASRPSSLPSSPPFLQARDSMLGGPRSSRPHWCKRKSWQCLMGETGPPAMSGQGSKVEQRTLKIPPSTGFEGNPENTLSHHQVPPRNASGFPGRSNSKEFPCEAKTQVLSLDLEDPLEKGMATRSSILAWRIPMERAAWWATVHGVAESQTRLHD